MYVLQCHLKEDKESNTPKKVRKSSIFDLVTRCDQDVSFFDFDFSVRYIIDLSSFRMIYRRSERHRRGFARCIHAYA